MLLTKLDEVVLDFNPTFFIDSRYDFTASYSFGDHTIAHLGTPRRTKSSVFLNIVQTAFDPPSPPRFWTFMLRIISRIMAPNSAQKYTKFAT